MAHAFAMQVFSEVFSREHQLMKVDPRKSTYLACCLLMRGKMSIADMNRNVARLKPSLRLVDWNSDGFKLGICSTPPVGGLNFANDLPALAHLVHDCYLLLLRPRQSCPFPFRRSACSCFRRSAAVAAACCSTVAVCTPRQATALPSCETSQVSVRPRKLKAQCRATKEPVCSRHASATRAHLVHAADLGP